MLPLLFCPWRQPVCVPIRPSRQPLESPKQTLSSKPYTWYTYTLYRLVTVYPAPKIFSEFSAVIPVTSRPQLPREVDEMEAEARRHLHLQPALYSVVPTNGKKCTHATCSQVLCKLYIFEFTHQRQPESYVTGLAWNTAPPCRNHTKALCRPSAPTAGPMAGLPRHKVGARNKIGNDPTQLASQPQFVSHFARTRTCSLPQREYVQLFCIAIISPQVSLPRWARQKTQV